MERTWKKSRLNPSRLLKAVRISDLPSIRGHLKIFLGMAAGVGKTYTMLVEAQLQKQKGKDTVVGLIDTHGRSETSHLLKGLDLVPSKKIIYRDKSFDELNLEEILIRKPQLVIIDELAHSNVPGAKNEKRWQDIIEILESGIDVYTTLNIQHVEGIKEIIENVADLTIRETVPDQLFNTKTTIQLVDLSPEELLTRLKEGKVYLGSQSQIAASNFFQVNRLMVLREITMRYAAELVDGALRYLEPEELDASMYWPSRDKLLVAIDHRVHSQELILTASRLAYHLNIPWIVAHIDDNRIHSKRSVELLEKNLELAHELGAEIVTDSNLDVAKGIERIVQHDKVTIIMLGRPSHSVFFPQKLTIYEHLSKECRHADIFVLRENPPAFTKGNISKKLAPPEPAKPYIFITSLTGLVGLASWFTTSYFTYPIIGLIFLLSLLFFSLFFKRNPLIVSSILFACIWSLFFSPVGREGTVFAYDVTMLATFLTTALVVGTLIDRAHKQKEILQRRNASIQVFYEIVDHIIKSDSPKPCFDVVRKHLESALDGECEIILSNPQGLLTYSESELLSDEKELHTALWVLENGKEAGHSTPILPNGKNYYIPLIKTHHPLGILAYRPPKEKSLSIEEKDFLHAVSYQLALYIARQTEQKTAA